MRKIFPVPTHVAIIPDGNRRWARKHGLTVYQGHKKGISAFRSVAEHAMDRGVECVSIWGMSVDNFMRRSPREVRGLIKIFHDEAVRMVHDEGIHRRRVRVRVFGRWREKFPKKAWRAMEEVEKATEHYTSYMLNFLLAYNGTDEMIRAIQRIAEDARGGGTRKVTAEVVKRNLFTRDLPGVDLVIRTGGEPHLSNGFMMWDIADAQLHFVDKFWPAFTPEDFDEALEEYGRRERRFGG